jgi:hypothetical protein
MGAWGVAPWDSDSAADWFGDLFDEIPLAAKVQATYEDEPELASAVAEEITVLKSRLTNNQGGPTVPQPTSWGKFWS